MRSRLPRAGRAVPLKQVLAACLCLLAAALPAAALGGGWSLGLGVSRPFGEIRL